jgi:hypothetical protein
MRPHARLVVGQIASALPEDEDYGAYDLMISSLPNFVRHFRGRGLDAEVNRLAFEPAVLDRVTPAERDVPVSFVGSVTPEHGARMALLEHLAAATDIAVWGRLDGVPEASPIRRRWRGAAWGDDMYRVLGRSRITINQHIDFAAGHANNMRLYEATGMGALLVTDWKEDLATMFDPGRDVVAYRSPQECADLVRHYLAHEDERRRIAAAGQARTLRDHTYRQRAAELVDLFAARLQAGR